MEGSHMTKNTTTDFSILSLFDFGPKILWLINEKPSLGCSGIEFLMQTGSDSWRFDFQ